MQKKEKQIVMDWLLQSLNIYAKRKQFIHIVKNDILQELLRE